MRASFAMTRNDIAPALSRMAATARNPRQVLQAMGNVFKSITEGNFSGQGSEYRPSQWPAKKDGSPATLKKSGLLWHSFHLVVDDHAAVLSNPTPYAAAHQFGYAPRNLPPRPFYPVIDGRLTPAAAEKIGAAGHAAAMKQFKGE